LGQFKNGLKHFGSVEKTVEKTLGLLKNRLKELWVCWEKAVE
jgi:hypothetical protein